MTPFKAMGMDFAEVKRVCDDCTIAGFKAIYEAVPAKPFRFLYFSADGVPSDPSKKPLLMGDYLVMRVSRSAMRPLAGLVYDPLLTCAYPFLIHRARLHGKSQTFLRNTRMCR